MCEIKAIKNTEHLCWKCLKEKDHIHVIYFGPLGYSSYFDNCSTKIQLCDECFNASNPDIWSDELVYDDENDETYSSSHYKYEDEIYQYFNDLPIEGRQFALNEFFDNNYYIDPQDWIDYKLGILPHKKAKEYGLYSTQEMEAYKQQFPVCKWPTVVTYNDGSNHCRCPFGASGNKDQNIGLNTSSECYQCNHFKERESNDLRKTFTDKEFKNYKLLSIVKDSFDKEFLRDYFEL